MFAEINPGIVIGGTAAAISVFAALAAIYLWAVNRTRRKLGPNLDPQTRIVAPWLVPLLPLTLIILCLGLIKALWQAYEGKSWPDATLVFFTAWPAFLIFNIWQRIRKSNAPTNHP